VFLLFLIVCIFCEINSYIYIYIYIVMNGSVVSDTDRPTFYCYYLGLSETLTDDPTRRTT